MTYAAGYYERRSLNNAIISTDAPMYSAFCSTPLWSDSSAGENVLVKVPGGRVTVGKPRDFPSYGWDNEYGQMEIEWVPLIIICVLKSNFQTVVSVFFQ